MKSFSDTNHDLADDDALSQIGIGATPDMFVWGGTGGGVHTDATVGGTSGNDFMHVLGDGHTAPTGYVDDPLLTNNGDTIDPGAGNDIFYAGTGSDTITVNGNGNDTINPGAGNNSVTVNGAGINTINSGSAGDLIFVYGSGTDTFNGIGSFAAGGYGDYTINSSGGSTVSVGANQTDFSGGKGPVVSITADQAEVFAEGEGNYTITGGGVVEITDNNAGADPAIDPVLNYTAGSHTDFVVVSNTVSRTIVESLTGGTAGQKIMIGANVELVGDFSKAIAGFGHLVFNDDAGAGIYNVIGDDGDNHYDFDLFSQQDETFASNGGKINGEGGNDDIRGTGNNDMLYGGDGNDRLNGAGHDDVLNGGAGDDVLIGGTGNDTLDGGTGTNTAVFTGQSSLYSYTLNNDGSISVSSSAEGNDRLTNIQFLQFADKTIAASTVGDTIVGANGDDTLNGTGGNDTITGAGGNNTINGLAGDDTIFAGTGTGTNLVHGNDGNDLLFAGGASAQLFGDAGDDTLWTYNGQDALNGGDGNDTLNVQLDGNDVLTGGAGIDTAAFFVSGQTGVTVSLETTGAQNIGGGIAGNITIGGVENLTGTQYADHLTGNSGNNVLSGGAGDDVLDLRDAGQDTALGGDGDDVIFFGSFLTASDKIDGGAGTDTLKLAGDYSAGIGFTATTMVNVEKISLAPGFSYFLRLNDANVVAGNPLTVDGSALGASDTLNVNGHTETDGNFILTGGAGNDILYGGANEDLITGGLGADHLTGGGGADHFIYKTVAESTSTGYDTITAFNPGTDFLDMPGKVSAVDATVATGTLSTATFDADLAAAVGASQLHGFHAVLFTPHSGTLSGDTFLIIDRNGTAGYQAGQDFVIQLDHATNLTGLSASTFI